tara:strand:+ start:134 stop:331 length:198 start_codon:yes stop_codon:yes gene_type:complete
MEVRKTSGLYAWRVQVAEPANWRTHEQVDLWLKHTFADESYVLAYTNVAYFKNAENAMLFAIMWS